MDDFSNYISKAEMTKTRWSPVFIKWVERKLTEWYRESKTGIQNRKLHEAIIMRSDGFKDFYEEAYPVFRYLKRSKLLSWLSFCKLTCSSECHYDVCIWSIFGSWKFEVTMALEQNHHIRMEKMLADGTVDSLSPIQYEGTKKNRQIEIKREAKNLDDLTEERTRWIEDCIRRKTIKKTKNQNYSGVDKLIICVDDFEIDPDRYPKIRRQLSRSTVLDQDTFSEIIIIGTMRELDLRFNCDNSHK